MYIPKKNMDFIECPPLISFQKKKLQIYKYIKIPKQQKTQIKKQKNPNNKGPKYIHNSPIKSQQQYYHLPK
jgi:hypothetical protein